jgi:hypothetical protein
MPLAGIQAFTRHARMPLAGIQGFTRHARVLLSGIQATDERSRRSNLGFPPITAGMTLAR